MIIKERVINPKIPGDRLSIVEEIIKGSIFWHSTLLDLGAGECKFSTISANYGMKVTAVDARTVRKPSKLHSSINFIHGNFLDMEFNSDYDLVFMFGVFYHLTVEEQLHLLSKFSGFHVVIDTHYVADDNPDLILESGYLGIPYNEGPDFQKMMENPKASATNLRSFWLFESSLYKMLGGFFGRVEKVVPEHYRNRTFFICRG